jgi:hypothetical protein
MSNGKDYKLFISTAGAATTPLAEVEMQGDLTINTGVTNERTPFKNGSVTGQGKAGWSASFQFAPREPTPTAQTELWDAHDNGTPLYIEIKATATGTMKWTGTVLVAITELTNPVSGARICSCDLSEDGTMVRGTVSA